MRTDEHSPSYPASESAHYLGAIRQRLEQLYEEHPNDPALREHLSDEVDWINAEIDRLSASANEREYAPDVAPCDDAEFGMKP
jgi:hypothetical protein